MVFVLTTGSPVGSYFMFLCKLLPADTDCVKYYNAL